MLYFDHNATTPLAPEVAEALSAGLREVYGNASSTHAPGQRARQQLEAARRTLARRLGAAPTEFVFTSGGTESNNLAILGLVRNVPAARRHVVTTTIEHPSVFECCRQLEREGIASTYVPVDRQGVVDVDLIRRSLREETVLVSIMHANNELGTIQQVEEIADAVREHRKAGHFTFFHSDGVQAFGKMDANVERLGIDLYSVSAHKISGPKGIGGLYVRRGTPLRSIQFGGRHERERRPGTENVPAAMAFARAAELRTIDTRELRDLFEREVLARVPSVEVNGSRESRLPNTSNLLFHGVTGEALVIALDMRGIAVSTGSACSSGAVEPSHVLLAIGRSAQDARSSVRFSFGRDNTTEDVHVLIESVVASVDKLRKAARTEHPVAASVMV